MKEKTKPVSDFANLVNFASHFRSSIFSKGVLALTGCQPGTANSAVSDFQDIPEFS
jgi:hypothetical protein